MIKTVLLIFLLIFSILGLTDFIYGLKMRITKPDVSATTYTVMFLTKGNAVEQMEYALCNLRWTGDEFCQCLIACNDELDDYETEECKKIAKFYNVVFCKSCSFSSVLEDLKLK